MHEIIKILQLLGVSENKAKQELSRLEIDNNIAETVVLPLLNLINRENNNSKLCLSHSMLLKLNASILVIANQEILYIDGVMNNLIVENQIPNVSYEALIRNIHTEDRAKFTEYVSLAMNNQQPEPLRIAVIHEGYTYWVEVNAEPTVFANQKAVQLLFVNVSDNVQGGLKKELFDEMLIEAESKRVDADKIIERNARIASIGLISSGLTHEINQPLNAIKMGADGLLMWESMTPNTFPERVLKIVKTIAKSSHRIDEIIKHLRSYWGGDAQRSPGLVSINETVNNSVKLLALKLKSHDIELAIDLDENIGSIYAEPMELELMINNIIIYSINNFDREPDRHDKIISISTSSTADGLLIKLSDNAKIETAIPNDLNFRDYSYNSETESTYNLELVISKLFALGNNADIRRYPNTKSGSDFIITFKKQ